MSVAAEKTQVFPLTFCACSPASCCRDRRDRHRSKSRDGSRGDKSVTIQAPGEPLLDNESTRGDERVSMREMRSRPGVSSLKLEVHQRGEGPGNLVFSERGHIREGISCHTSFCLVSQGWTLFQ